MNVEDVTGADIASVIAATIDAAVDAYPELVIPDNDVTAGGVFNTRVTAVTEDTRFTVHGRTTVDIEVTDRDGIARTFTITITTQEKP